MNITARQENELTLASALSIKAEVARGILDATVLITCDESNPVCLQVGMHVGDMLRRTFSNVVFKPSPYVPKLEVIIGCIKPRVRTRHIWVTVGPQSAVVSDTPGTSSICNQLHKAAILATACYVCAKVFQEVVGGGERFRVPDPLEVVFEDLGIDPDLLAGGVNLGDSYLFGAGAVGNGFLVGLSCFSDIRGRLDIVDHDIVTDGNLGRCLWFSENDIGKKKADVLVEKGKEIIGTIRLCARSTRWQELEERGRGAWLKRVIVAVDSRRERRKIQAECPKEVFDASTTGVEEVVFHYNRHGSGLACLGCIYVERVDELAGERHIAEVLGVGLQDVQEGIISPKASAIIQSRYGDRFTSSLVGQAYTSLFKALCSEGKIRLSESRQVLAPFAFVSVLAGLLLAIEVVRRAGAKGAEGRFNYWRVRPWSPPVPALQQERSSVESCVICGNPAIRQVAYMLWSGGSEAKA